jgi:VCBS repeat-containing protein
MSMASSNGPQAKEDVASGAGGRSLLIDVMSNDAGGDAKHLVSVNAPASTTWATTALSKFGATVSIVGDQVSYNPSSAYLQGLPLGQTVVDTFTYTIQLGNGASSTAAVSVTVRGSNHAPTVTGTMVRLSTEDGAPVSVNALGAASDVDGQSLQVIGLPAALPAGVTYDAASHNFRLDPANAAYQPLAAGDATNVTVTYAVSDGTLSTPASVSWTVTGVNDAASITGVSTGSVTEDVAAHHTASGTLIVADVDHGEAHLQTPMSLAGAHGAFTLDAASGQWGYTLNNADPAVQALAQGQTTTDMLTVKSADGTASQVITVTITGTNDPVVLDATTQSGAVTEDLNPVSGQLKATGAFGFTDADLTDTHNATASFVSASGVPAGFTVPAAGLGTLSPVADDAGHVVNWTYSVDDASVQGLGAHDVITETYKVSVSDGNGSTVDKTVTVTVNGVNDPVVLDATTQSGAVTEDVAVQNGNVLKATGAFGFTDADLTDTHSAAVSFVSASGVPAGFTLPAAGLGTLSPVVDDGGHVVNWTYSVDDAAVQGLGAHDVITETYKVSVSDGNGSPVHKTVTVTLNGVNDPVVLDATTQSGAVTEDAAVQTGNVLKATGAFGFTDADLTDTHSAAVSFVSASGVPAGFTLAAAGLGTLSPVVDETGKVVNWTYSADNAAVQGLGAHDVITETYKVSVSDGNGSAVDKTVTVTVTVNGVNDPVVLDGSTQSGAVTEDLNPVSGQLKATGAFGFTDADLTDTHSATASFISASGVPAGFTVPAAGLGTLSPVIDETGKVVNWTYSADNAAVQGLGAHDVITETYKVSVSDGNGSAVDKTVTVTVNGVNDPVVLDSSTQSGVVTQDLNPVSGQLKATGAFGFTDADLTDTHSATVSFISASGAPAGFTVPAAGLGTLSPVIDETGKVVNWTYSVDDAAVQGLGAHDVITETYKVSVSDGNGSAVDKTVTVTVNGVNDPVVLDGSTQSGAVTEDLNPVSGQLKATGAFGFTDADLTDTHSATASFISASGVPAGFTLPAAGLGTLSPVVDETGKVVNWTYSVDDASVQGLGAHDVITETYKVSVSDGNGSTVDQTVTLAINGTNDPAVFGGVTTGSVNEDDAAHGVASGTLIVVDRDAGESHLVAPTSLAGAHGAFALDTTSGAWTYALNNADPALQTLNTGQTVTDTLTVHSTDGTAQNLIVTIHGATDLQLNNAAADQVIALDQGGANTRWEFALNSDEFIGAGAYSYNLSATLADGSPLPAQLTFDANRGLFLWSGAGTPGASYDVKVTATDGSHTVSDVFKLTTTAESHTVSATGGLATGTSGDDLILGDGYMADANSRHGQLNPIATATGAGYLTTPTTTIAPTQAASGAAATSVSVSSSQLVAPIFVGPALPSQGATTIAPIGTPGSVLDDGYTQLDMTKIFGPGGLNFFGNAYSTAYLGVNGVMSFAAPIMSYIGSAFPTRDFGPVIAPFWADVDLRGPLTAAETAAGFTNNIYYNLDSLNGALTITWDGVGYFNSHADKLNSFQLQIIPIGDQGDFDVIFRYQSINWDLGDFSNNIAASIGFDAGNGVQYYNTPQSLTAAALNMELAGNTFPVMPGTLEFTVGLFGISSPGSDLIRAVSSSNGAAETLNGGQGDDILMGGGGTDVFVFHPGDGKDIIRDFAPGATGGSHDILQLLGFGTGLDSFGDVLAHAVQVGGNVVITTPVGDTITLEGVKVNELTASDVAFNAVMTATTATDTFVLNSGAGGATIVGFTSGSATGHDIVRLLGYGETFTDVMAHATNVGGDAVITLNGTDTLTLQGVITTSLTSADFLFV